MNNDELKKASEFEDEIELIEETEDQEDILSSVKGFL